MNTLGKIGITFLLVGILILVGGLYWTQSTISFVGRAQALEASVVSTNEETCESSSKNRSTYTCYRPVVTYTLEGKSYEVGLPETSSEKPMIGSKIAVYIDPKVPQEARSQGFGTWMGPMFLNLFGLVFSAVGFFAFRSYLRTKRLIKTLLMRGLSASGKVVFCGYDQSIKVNGRSPFRIEAIFKVPLTGEVIRARTLEELWIPPESFGITVDSSVQVLFDPQNPKQCMVVLPKDSSVRVAA
ncbi:MAG: DUF3592 domain-containing protein [bacterium]